MFAPPPGQDPELILQQLSNELMSPYCPGRTISSCPSAYARKLEDDILAQAQAGKSRDEIEQGLVARFGPEIVGYAPQPAVLYGSLLVGLVALVLVALAARRWVRRPGARASGPQAPEPESDLRPTRAELDELEDALDEEDGF
jgi:cytochrome c-type biogenesis protein CcmH/NrfF